MDLLLTTLHIMVCILLVAVVLLQHGKGADMGAALGGGASNTVFGARGAGNFLTKMTTACAIIFMLTSLTLSYLSIQESRIAIFDEEVADIAPSTRPEEAASAEAGDANVLQEIDVKPVPLQTDEPATTETEAPAAPSEEGSAADPTAPATP